MGNGCICEPEEVRGLFVFLPFFYTAYKPDENFIVSLKFLCTMAFLAGPGDKHCFGEFFVEKFLDLYLCFP